MTGKELEQFTLQHLPEAFFGKALRAVYAGHKVSFEECRDSFAATEAKNVTPYYRRGKIEGYLRDAAEMFSGVTAHVVPGEGGWNHTEVRSGPIIMTASSVQTPCGIVEKAEFRKTLARNNEMRLWHEPGDDPAADAPLYVLLLHSRSEWPTVDEWREYGHLPGSVYVAYPSPNLESYPHTFNLFERFPDIVKAQVPETWDTDAVVRYVDRSRRAYSG